MNPVKTKFKIDMAEAFGRKFEGMEDEAEHSFYRQEGARDALKAVAPKIGELMAHIDEEIKSGALDEIGEPLKVAAYAKKWLQRAIGSIDGLATQAEVARIGMGGKMKGLKDARQYAFNVWKEEQAKLQSYLNALEDDVLIEDGKAPDGHPGPTLKSKRRVEEPESKEPTSEEPTPSTETKPEPLKKGKKGEAGEKKKRLRQPKKKR